MATISELAQMSNNVSRINPEFTAAWDEIRTQRTFSYLIGRHDAHLNGE
jgi:hypothetical protein